MLVSHWPRLPKAEIGLFVDLTGGCETSAARAIAHGELM